MTGRRPERTRALNFDTDFRKQHGDSWISMPQHFKNNGYFTSAAGKLYHDGMDDPASWSYPSNQTKWLGCGEGDYIDPNHEFITHRLYRQHCFLTEEGYYVKDLRIFADRDLKDVVIVDNSVYSFAF